MKKTIMMIIGFFALLVLVGCGSTAISETPMANETSVASLSYISAEFIEAELALETNDTGDSSQPVFLSNTTFLVQPTTTTSFEGELDYINIYLDKLKVFMGDGLNSVDVSSEEESDKEEYTFMFTYQVEGDQFTIYYNVDEETEDITGLLVWDDLEFDLVITDNTTEEDGESKRDIRLVATKEEDSITIRYVTIAEEGETKDRLTVLKDIAGMESELEIEIKEDVDGTFKVDIDEGANEYTFKVETTDEGTHYKLDYTVDGVSGFVLINETTDENGDPIYTYQIHENGVVKDVEKDKPEKPEKTDKDKS